MELMECKDDIVGVVKAVHALLDLDLIVVDRWLMPLINTFQYQHPNGDMRLNSIVGNIIVTNAPQMIQNRAQSRICSACQDYSKCELEYILGVPIRRENECIGALAALLRTSQISLLKDSGVLLQSFLEQLALSFTALLESRTLHWQLSDVNTQILRLSNDFSDLVVLTDDRDVIRFANNSFGRCFGRQPEELRDTLLTDLLQTCAPETEKVKLQQGSLFPCTDGTLADLVGIFTLTFGADGAKKLYVFRALEATAFLNPYVGYERESRFQRFWATSEAMQQARLAAIAATRNNLPVLIVSSSTTRSRELMKMLSQMTPGTSPVSSVVNCTIDADELEMILFGGADGRPGLIQPPRNCCVCLSNVHCMPLYLQKRLTAFLDQRQYQGKANGRVSIYTTTTVDLYQYAADGYFSADLLNLISVNRIVIPPIWADVQDAKFYFVRFLREFSEKYQLDIQLDTEKYWSGLLASGNQPEYLELRSIAERLVSSIKNNGSAAAQDAILSVGGTDFPEDTPRVRTEDRLRALLATEKNKSKIAKTLGISRATLYRWLERYDLE